MANIGVKRFAIEQQIVDLVPIVECVVELQRGASADHTLKLLTPGQSVFARVDEFRIEQVLGNLLSNAIKYSPDGGPVEIVVEQRDTVPNQPVDGTHDGRWVAVTIRDHGLGIAEEPRDGLFERLYRAPNAQGRISGMGLGLFISREIMQRHGGVIWVESEEGKGSLFGIALPAVDRDAPQVDGRSSEQTQPMVPHLKE